MSVKLSRVFSLKTSWALGNRVRVEKKGREAAEPMCGWITRPLDNTALPLALRWAPRGPESGHQRRGVLEDLIRGNLALHRGQVGSPRSGCWKRQPDSAMEGCG